MCAVKIGLKIALNAAKLPEFLYWKSHLLPCPCSPVARPLGRHVQ